MTEISPVGQRLRSPAKGMTEGKGGAARLPLLTKAALIAMLVPAYFSLGSLALSPSKVLFLVLVPYFVINLFRGSYGRFLVTDGLVLAYAFWMTVAMLVNHTPRVAVEYTGSNTVTLLGGYLAARATIRTREQFIALIRFLAIVVLLSFPFALYETMTSRTTIPRWIDQLPFFESHNDVQHEPRLGFWRVQFVFAHPIHYGIFCSMVFSLVLIGMAGVWDSVRRMIVAGIVGLCCFLSVSSGPFLALVSQFALIGWGWGMRWTGMRWRILGIIVLVGYTVIELASTRSGIFAVVSRLSFSPSTAFSRRVLFEYGVAQIQRDPVFGKGYNPWPLPPWMTGSIDNFWLFLAIVFGLPALLFFAGAFLVSMVAVGRRDFSAAPALQPLRLAWMFTMISLSLVLATVAIWGEMYAMVLFVLGSGLWMITAETSPQTPQPQSPDTGGGGRAALRYSRFSTRPAPARTGIARV